MATRELESVTAGESVIAMAGIGDLSSLLVGRGVIIVLGPSQGDDLVPCRL